LPHLPAADQPLRAKEPIDDIDGVHQPGLFVMLLQGHFTEQIVNLGMKRLMPTLGAYGSLV